MIRVISKIGLLFSLVLILEIMPSGCSERDNVPVLLPDSTLVFPSKNPDGISAKITFSRNFGQKSGRQSAITTVFPLKVNENIYAVIALENRLKYIDRDLMFHIEWVGQDGNSVYMKRIDLITGDSTSALVSSISIEPDKRPQGDYMLRIYLFRELIAEKRFELRNESEMESVSGNIIFYKTIDKETGAMKGVDTVFEIKKKGILRARIELSKLHIYQDDELPFRLEWIGPDGESFYSKKAEVNPADTLSIISGSVSITPDKRAPGEYFLRVYLFEDIVAEKRFELKPAD